jgi:hypothetical protein
MAKSGVGIGSFLWRLAVALYLIANGVLGITKVQSGDFWIIFNRIGLKGDTLNLCVIICGVIAVVAGIALLLAMFSKSLPSIFFTLIFIIAIIWAVYVVLEIISWVTGGFANFWGMLQMLAVHIMVLASLLIASRKFD